MDKAEVIAEWNGKRFYGVVNEYGIVVVTRPVPVEDSTDE